MWSKARLFGIALVAFLVGCQTGVAGVAYPSVAAEAQAVRQLTMDYDHDGDPDSSCTVWKAGGYGVWVTAKHCTEADEAPAFHIGVRPAIVWECADAADICTMMATADEYVGTLPIGQLPAFGDRVHVIGYPHYDVYHYGVYDGRWGKCYAEPGEQGGGEPGECEISLMADGGASGSPVIDEGGAVVGVLVSGYRGRPYTYVVPVDKIRALLESL